MLSINFELGTRQLPGVVGDRLFRLIDILVVHIHDRVLQGLGLHLAVGGLKLAIRRELVAMLNVVGGTLNRMSQTLTFSCMPNLTPLDFISCQVLRSLYCAYLKRVDLLTNDLIPGELALVLHVVAGTHQVLLLVVSWSFVLMGRKRKKNIWTWL